MVLGRLRVLFKVIMELCKLEVYRGVVRSRGNECPFQTFDGFSGSRSRFVRKLCTVQGSILTSQVPHNMLPVLAIGVRRKA